MRVTLAPAYALPLADSLDRKPHRRADTRASLGSKSTVAASSVIGLTTRVLAAHFDDVDILNLESAGMKRTWPVFVPAPR